VCSGFCSDYEFFSLLMNIDGFRQAETGQYDAEKV